MLIKPGKYVHFKGNEYEVIDTATHSETLEEMVIYRALQGDGGLWTLPASVWNGIVEVGGQAAKRFTPIDEVNHVAEIPSEPLAEVRVPEIATEAPADIHIAEIPSESLAEVRVSEIATEAPTEIHIAEIPSEPLAEVRIPEIATKAPAGIHVAEIAPEEPATSGVHDAETTTEPLAEIHNRSTPREKIALFMSLFSGRDDVFAKRWENTKKGSAGYAPVCFNEWSPLCPKSSGDKIKCGECPNHNFARYDTDAVEKHLKGRLTTGVYPMFHDETCRFLAFDFDGKDYSPEDLRHDTSAIRRACAEKNISMAVERSRSGKGIHFWIFFTENIPASKARQFGSSLITYAMSRCHELSFKTYDRMIPSQDTLPKGKFGNLIALPLQKKPREHGNSVFVDENFDVYADQWNYLYNVKRYKSEEIDSLIYQLSPSNELGDLRQDADDEKPWEGKKAKAKSPKLTKADFPEKVKIVCGNMLYIDKSGISSPALNALKRLAAFRNPEFYKAQAMRLSTHKIPRIISCSDERPRYLCLPRGLEDETIELLEHNSAAVQFSDETNKGREIDVEFNGELRGEQQQAANEMLKHNNGILSATTAFGKTVIGAYLIANRKVNTLILVHRTSIMSHWKERLKEFLLINEEPVLELTPKGRKRKKNIIGQIGGGKNNPSGVIDVAVMQSLVSGDDVKELVKNYGMVIADECHHVSAFSFEQILKSVTAKYVYGLTATPTRKDGHHPIIYMHCGKIRYRVDAKAQAAARPFEHFVIPRFTRFQKPAHQDENMWSFANIYNDIQHCELRNSLIIQDVISAVEQGRNPIILTERIEHVRYLASQLNQSVKNVIVLTGGETQKKSREILRIVADIPGDEAFVLIATGRYVGEGFDMPRLDTLFLAMPISWKGTLQQYAGRLHRLYEGKKEVQVYDYVDVHVAMLEKMYQKRLRGYAAIGYKAKGTPHPIEEVHSIFDNKTFSPVYSADVMAAKSEILIVSPFLAKRRLSSALHIMTTANAKVTVLTKPPENYADKDRSRIRECIELLAQNGIAVKTRDRIHQKFAIMDQRVVWYGSINLLSYGASEESIMRIENVDIAGELLRSV